MNLISLLIFFFLLENLLLAKNLHTDIAKNKFNWSINLIGNKLKVKEVFFNVSSFNLISDCLIYLSELIPIESGNCLKVIKCTLPKYNHPLLRPSIQKTL